MNVLLSAFAILFSILAIFINQWVTFLPQLGIGFQYHRRRAQLFIATVAILTTLALYLANPTTGQLIVLIVVVLLTPLSGFSRASKTLVAIDQPEHVAASASGWQEDVLVMGYAADEQTAVAWLLDTLIPHHLINDTVNKEHVLAAW